MHSPIASIRARTILRQLDANAQTKSSQVLFILNYAARAICATLKVILHDDLSTSKSGSRLRLLVHKQIALTNPMAKLAQRSFQSQRVNHHFTCVHTQGQSVSFNVSPAITTAAHADRQRQKNIKTSPMLSRRQWWSVAER